MPCAGMTKTPEQRAEDERRVRALELDLARGRAKVRLDRMGKATFEGWSDRGDLHDDCTYRLLVAEGSSAIRMALARSQGRSNEGRRLAT